MNKKMIYLFASILTLVISFTLVCSPIQAHSISSASNPIILPGFPVRSVVIMPTRQNYKQKPVTKDYIHYFENQLLAVYKIPYYNASMETSNYMPPPSPPTKEYDGKIFHKQKSLYADSNAIPNKTYLQSIAKRYKADIIIVPIINNWTYEEVRYKTRLNPYRSMYDDDREPYYETYLHLSVYSYNSQKDTVTHTEIRRSFTGEAYEVPNPGSMWKEAVGSLIQKLPYKRIPTDIPRYIASNNSLR